MIRKVISNVCYVIAGFSVFLVSIFAFIFGILPLSNLSNWGVFGIPGLISLIIGLAINGFQNWKHDVGLVLLSGIGCTSLLFLIAFLAFLTPENRTYIADRSYDSIIQYVCNILILSAIGTALIKISKIETTLDISTQEKKKNIRSSLVTLAGVIILLFIVGANFSLERSWPSRPNGFLVGDEAPNIVLQDLNGNTFSLENQRGSVVLFDFWATWCAPCRKKLPLIQKLHEKYGDNGLMTLAISFDNDKSLVKPFLEKNNYTFQVLFADSKVKKDYRIRGIPTVCIVDRKGVVRLLKIGGSKRELESLIKELLDM
ncbi:TlpA family protein disulfide reductase [Candidatus Latescibacterota bacterium]